MAYHIKCFLLLSCFVIFTYQASYKAAVVEYAIKISTSNISEHISKNVDNYIEIITDSANVGTDIIVFPESTLNNGFTSDRARILDYSFEIPDPLGDNAPCDSRKYHKALQRLSCSAKSSKIYVVINISEKNICREENYQKHCAKDGYNIYNSNIVFDRTGRIISRYRKTHLFGEPAFNITSTPEVETFTTDFNVTFGHLICFDMMFSTPSMKLLKERRVKNFIVPMMWYSELPFLTALQFQESWAFTHNVNLLVAGANSPSSGTGGSGIYAGKYGAQTAFLSGNFQNKVLTSLLSGDVTSTDNNVKIETINPGGMRLLKDKLDNYSWKVMDFAKTEEVSENICYGEFCCNIYARISKQTGDNIDGKHYMAVAFDGVRSYSGVTTGGVQTCGVIACSGETIVSCGKGIIHNSNQEMTFEEIIITGNFRSKNSTQFPVSVQDNLTPLAPDNYIFSTKTSEQISNIKLQLTKHTKSLLTFAVFGRDFSKDGTPITPLNKPEMDAQIDFIAKKIKTFSLRVDNLINNTSTGEKKNETIENIEQTYWEYFSIRLQICLFAVTIYFLEML